MAHVDISLRRGCITGFNRRVNRHGVYRLKKFLGNELASDIRLQGQVRGLQKMIEEDRYCVESKTSGCFS